MFKILNGKHQQTRRFNFDWEKLQLNGKRNTKTTTILKHQMIANGYKYSIRSNEKIKEKRTKKRYVHGKRIKL